MNIDFNYKGLRLVWDTDRRMVVVFKPMEQIDSFEMPHATDVNYKDFIRRARDYVDYVYTDMMNQRRPKGVCAD